jgi:hypothetical protein
MPTDSIMDIVNNVEPLYTEKVKLFDRWVQEGDAWTETKAKREATRFASELALAIAADFDTGRYSRRDVKEAVDEMLKEFEDYREEAIEEATKWAAKQPVAPEPMTPSEIEFTQKCEALAQQIGLDPLRQLIPAPPEQIRRALERGDKHLNTIPLYRWDGAAAYIRAPGLSLSEKVCALKHVATWHYA